jgi:predicted lipoprotein with Yx(FWY)xxD motif
VNVKAPSHRTGLALALLVGALGLAACGSNDSSSSTTSSTSAAAPASGSAAAVDLASSGDLGQVLVDADGRTLYLFEKDDEGDESYCSDECAKDWPPFSTRGTPQAGDGVDASKLTTFKREDGTTQVAFGEHPLYYFSGDKAAGDANGNGLDEFGAEWYAVTSAGEPAEEGDESSSSESTSTTESSGGYGY